jgi:hypothetical protein
LGASNGLGWLGGKWLGVKSALDSFEILARVKSRLDNHIKESISKPELFWYNVVIVTKQ